MSFWCDNPETNYILLSLLLNHVSHITLFEGKNMKVIRLFVATAAICISMISSAVSQSYSDDSLAVAEILKANGLDSISVQDVSSTTGDRITELYLDGRGLSVLPECVGKLTGLSKLLISNNQLKQLPDSIGQLTNLDYINASDNLISGLPEGFRNLQKLVYIYLIRSKISRWPDVFDSLQALVSIDLGVNNLTSIPEKISTYTKMRYLYINDNYITTLPDCIVDIQPEVIHTAGNALCSLSPEIISWLNEREYYKEDSKWLSYQECGRYPRDSLIVRQILDNNGWTELSVSSVSTVVEGNITALDFSEDNRSVIKTLMKRTVDEKEGTIHLSGLERLMYLRALNLSGNNLSAVPESLSVLCHLQNLDLSDNALETLPDFITSFQNLDSLELSGNQIAALPPEVKEWADTFSPEWASEQNVTSVNRSINMISENAVSLKLVGGDKLRIFSARPCNVNISIYSLSGRKVMTIANRKIDSGNNEIAVNKGLLSRGTYLIRLKEEGHAPQVMKLFDM